MAWLFSLKKAITYRQVIGVIEEYCKVVDYRVCIQNNQTVWRSNLSILKETNPKDSLEGLMLKLKLQYFRYLSQIIRKDPDAGKDWRQEKGTTGNEIIGWHHWLNGHEFEKAPGDGEGQGSLVCYSPWGLKEWVTIEQMNTKQIQRRHLLFYRPASLYDVIVQVKH